MSEKLYLFKGIYSGDELTPKETIIRTTDNLITDVFPLHSKTIALDLLSREYENHYAIPGFIDCHVHLALDGCDFNKAKETWGNPSHFDTLVRANLEALKNAGIIACRDGSANCSINLWLSSHCLPSVHHTYWALRKEGYYGSFLGPAITSLEDGIKMIEALAHHGARAVKILLSGIMSFQNFGKVGPCQFSLKEARTLVSHAKNLGLPVMAHASGAEAIDIALAAGVDSIEHGYYMTETQLDNLVEKQIYWVPTVIPVEKARDFCKPEELLVINRILEEHKVRIRQGYEKGALFAIGTDAGAQGVFAGNSFLEELDIFTQTGIPMEAVLRMATTNGAKLLGEFPYLGQIAPRSSTTINVLKQNPLKAPFTRLNNQLVTL